MVVVGADVHKRTHTFVAVDEVGRHLGEKVVAATTQGHRQAVQWARTLGRMVAGRTERSPLVRITRAKAVDVKLRKPMTYELDGGARGPTTRLKVRIRPAAITVCVPADRYGHDPAAAPSTRS